MIKRADELQVGDLLPFRVGETGRIVEVFELPSGGAGKVSNCLKITITRGGEEQMTICQRETTWEVK